jgi:hypothetical protein
MQITINLNTDDANDLAALAALAGALGGRTVTPGEFEPPIGTRSATAVSQPTPSAPIEDADDTVDPAVVAGAPTTDSAGIPWDERIHSASRATIADGTWRRRKNTPDVTYEAVMAELRGGANPTPVTSPDDTPPPPSEPAVTAPVEAAATSAADVPPPPASDGPDLSTFPKFVQAVNSKDVPADRKTYGALNELCASFGVAAFKDMKDKSSDWAMFYDMVG